jgi:hypothetical protein
MVLTVQEARGCIDFVLKLGHRLLVPESVLLWLFEQLGTKQSTELILVRELVPLSPMNALLFLESFLCPFIQLSGLHLLE